MEDSAVRFLVDKVGSALLEKLNDEVSVIVNFRDDFQWIHQEVVRIRFLLNDAGDKTNSQSMANWVQNLRDVLTDAMDLVEQCGETDTYIYRAISVPVSCHWIKGTIIFLRRMGNKFRSQRKIGHEIKNLKHKIKETNDSGNKYVEYVKSLVDVNQSLEGENTKSCSRLPENHHTVGIEEDIDAISELILKKDGPAVIAVLGMAGQGKTRLLQHVFNSKRVRRAFKHFVWLSVSEKFTIEHLLLELADQIKLGGDELTIKDYYHKLTEVSIEGLRARIRREIINVEEEVPSLCVRLIASIHRYFGESKKPCLLVLDDVWDKNVLRKLGLVSGCQNYQNKILVSTRDRGVSDAMGAHIHRMKKLSDKDSLNLFSIHAFKDVSDRKLVQEFKHQILEKCTRVPMAVEAIAKKMANVSSNPNHWEKALLFLDEKDIINKSVVPNVRSSYNALPCHLKACFHYFASFPPNTPIKAECLVYAWLASFGGFLHGEERFSAARSYLQELVDRCVIEALRVGEDGLVRICQIQDLFYGIARSESRKEARCLLRAGEAVGHLPVIECKNARRISLANNNISKIDEAIQCPDLRILSLSDNPSLKSISESFFNDKLKHVAVLDLSRTGIKLLPKSIGKLKGLKFLNLSRTMIEKLPESLRRLRRLLFLDVGKCEHLRKLHSGIGEHAFLLYLNMTDCRKLKSLPPGISKLRRLRTLKLKGAVSTYFFRDFKDMADLQHVSATFNSKTLSAGFDLLRTWMPMRNMRDLSLQYKSSGDVCFPLPQGLGVIERLERLRLHMLLVPPPASTFWNYHLQNLKELILEGDDHSHDGEYYKGIEMMPNLKRLRLFSNKNCVNLPKEFGKPRAFPKLETLNIDDFHSLQNFPPLQDNAMPMLRFLQIRNCGEMRDMPKRLDRLNSLQEIRVDPILRDRAKPSYIRKLQVCRIKILKVNEEAMTEQHDTPWNIVKNKNKFNYVEQAINYVKEAMPDIERESPLHFIE